MMPRVVLLGGVNGAGKTTASMDLLRTGLQIPVFTNADTIARGLNSLDPESEAFRAGRVMLDWIAQLAKEGRDFAFETTLAARTYAGMIKDWREKGYEVHLYYYWLDSPEMAIERIQLRVKSGGHFVPDEDVRRRYARSVRNFLELYSPICDVWEVYENTYRQRKLLAMGSCSEYDVDNEPDWQSFVRSANHDE